MSKPLVVCAICERVVDKEHAKKTEIETSKGYLSVWVCGTCLHLGSEEATRKYVMKEEKTIGR